MKGTIGGLEHGGVGVVCAGRHLADDAGGSREAGDIVHVTVGVVAREPFVDPEDLFGAHGGAQCGFSVRL